jgi:hypothetical protein
MYTAAADEVRTTRRTVPAFTHDLITFSVPGMAGSISSFWNIIAKKHSDQRSCVCLITK